VRRFIKGDSGMVSKFVSRLIGSPDIYGEHTLEPAKSVNFITCHDGFTLADLVSYNHKHNMANGENNRDGCYYNFSWNHGTEGVTADPKIVQLRLQQMKNMMTINLISLGTPMILMGDEIARTQKGNNNGYCQDTADFWFNWHDIEANRELFRFTKVLIKQRAMLEVVCFNDTYRHSLHDIIEQAGIIWHGIKLNKPDWGPHSHAIALESKHPCSNNVSYIIINAFWKRLVFELPECAGGKWQRVIDTSLTDGKDIYCKGDKKQWVNKMYSAAAHSVVILLG